MCRKTVGEGSEHGPNQTFFVGIVLKITEVNSIYLFLCLLYLRQFKEKKYKVNKMMVKVQTWPKLREQLGIF